MKFFNRREREALKFQKLVLTMQSVVDAVGVFTYLSAAMYIARVGV